jgi:transposase
MLQTPIGSSILSRHGYNADDRGMPAPLPLEVRKRMIKAYDEGLGTQEAVARVFGVTRKCLSALLRRRRQTGSVAPSPHGGGSPAVYIGARLADLWRLVRQQPDATLEELREQTDAGCSVVTVHNTLKRLGLRLKKRRFTPASKTGRT